MNENSAEVQQAVTAALDEQKKKKKKKKLIIAAVILVIIIAVAALASSGNSDENSSSNGGTVSASEENTNSNGGTVSVSEEAKPEGTIGDYVCTVKSAKLCKNWEGKDSVKITYSFTNNNSEPHSFDIALEDNVYQDGIGLEQTFINGDDDDDFGIDVKIKQGVTKDVSKVYILRDKTTDLEVEIGEWISFDDTKIVTTVSLS